MKRTARIATWALALIALSTSAVHAKKKKKKAKVLSPVTVTVKNLCKTELVGTLGELPIKVAAGQTSAAESIPGKEDQSFQLNLTAPTPGDLGLLGFAPGTTYAVEIRDCRNGAADVVTKIVGERPAKISPNAASEIRFRARQNVHLEYKFGKVGSFKPLSIAMTRYKEQAGGDLNFTFRLRVGNKRGPVVGMVRKTVKLEPGHRYLIEANVIGKEILFKYEDEGWREKG
jgi:hypothetical protein